MAVPSPIRGYKQIKRYWVSSCHLYSPLAATYSTGCLSNSVGLDLK